MREGSPGLATQHPTSRRDIDEKTVEQLPEYLEAHEIDALILVHGIPINYLSRWLGHSSIQTTLIYLELVPDPTGSLASVP